MEPRPTLTNLFIVGAPRCGTTAMSSYLAEHPQIDFSDPKEPLFFCTDMPGVRAVEDVSEYESKFFPASEHDPHERIVRAEGSVWYLSSKTAVPNILEYNPNALFVVMLRNPVEMLSSLHQKLLLFLDENENNFERAWSLQESRSRGDDLPDTCREPKLLEYRRIGKLGAQVERMSKLVDSTKIHYVLYDDFAADPGSAYHEVLQFLGLDNDGRQSFARVNANKKVLNRHLHERLYQPPAALMKIINTGKSIFGLEKLGILRTLRAKMTPERAREPIDPIFKAELMEEFTDDIELLGQLINKDLSMWGKS